ncbi:MAG: 50S ribosomal protein L3 [Ignavibacteriae bacterium]|nr:50S ribosomal protein L3 [Ignavibacteriota bacterium]MCB9216314.1 50S ribosomal protein L3 [Ignavibacteria bacterium]
MPSLLGKKLGMSGIFSDDGVYIPCTLIEAGPCTILQVKNEDVDGYEAVQMGFGYAKDANLNQPMRGHLAKANASAPATIREFRTFAGGQYAPGDVINVGDLFEAGDMVNITGTSKGKGFQGVVKRHGFSGVGGRTHGQHNRERAPGSIGQSSYPSRVFKGMRMAGRMGGKRSTIRGLQVVAVIPDENLIVVKGSVPGAINSVVEINKN